MTTGCFKGRPRGFTLIEIVSVVAIICVLAAIAIPVIASARRSAHQTMCLSNLRQCGVALTLYANDWDTLPTGQSAIAALSGSPTCDPRDNWRQGCDSPFSAPRIGSYGYVRLCPAYSAESDWQKAINSEQPPKLLVSIFYGSRQVQPFVGMEPKWPACAADFTCIMPDHLVCTNIDLSAKSIHAGSTTITNGVGFEVFTWPTAFSR